MTDRGQTFTLEAFVAAILLLSTVAFALQVVSISSNTASAADAEIRSQHAGLAVGVLDQGAANGSLRRTTLYWDEVDERFYGASDDGYYIGRAPPTAFGGALGAMFRGRQVRYNVDLYYRTAAGERARQRLVESGTADDDAVRVTETVTLYDGTKLVDANENERSLTLNEVAGNTSKTFYAPDARPDSRIYNVVRVEVVLWET